MLPRVFLLFAHVRPSVDIIAGRIRCPPLLQLALWQLSELGCRLSRSATRSGPQSANNGGLHYYVPEERAGMLRNARLDAITAINPDPSWFINDFRWN